MALSLSSQMVVVSVIGALKISRSHKLAEVESLLNGVRRRVVLGFAGGLGHASLLFGRLVAYGPASESEEIA
jgi:hypothetical protein